MCGSSFFFIELNGGPNAAFNSWFTFGCCWSPGCRSCVTPHSSPRSLFTRPKDVEINKILFALPAALTDDVSLSSTVSTLRMIPKDQRSKLTFAH